MRGMIGASALTRARGKCVKPVARETSKMVRLTIDVSMVANHRHDTIPGASCIGLGASADMKIAV